MAQNESMTNDLAASAQTVKKAANAAVAAGKAVSKAATGNLAGAAIEVVKNKELRNFIIGLIVVLLVLPMFAILSLPAITFAAAEELTNSLDEEMLAEISDSGNSFEEFFTGIGYWVNRLTGNLGDKSNTILGTGAGEDDEFDSMIYDSVYDEDAAVYAIKTQIDKIMRRFESRKEQYQKLLDDIATDFEKKPPVDEAYDYVHVTSFFDAPTVSEEEALQYLTAYSIQTDNNIENITLRSLLSWIGSYNGVFKTDEYIVEGNTYKTFDWTGTYLPQYQHEQLLQEIRNSWQITAFDTDSFLEQVYYVDKQTGINVSYEYVVEQEIELVPVIKTPEETSKPSEETVSGEEGESTEEETPEASAEPEIEWVEKVVDKIHLYISITMTVTKEDAETIPSKVMGFWDGSLEQRDPETGLNRVEEGTPPEYLCYSWTANGNTFTRQKGYQTSYYRDMLQATADYIGIKTIDLGKIDFSVVGATTASTAAAEAVVQIAEGELGTIGGSPYWNLGAPGQDWCNWFVKWCGLQAGLSDLFGHMSGGVITTWQQYGGYVDRVNVRYRSGSNQYGTAIVAEDTVLLESERLSSDKYIPQRGDLVFFADTRPSMNGLIAHIGIVESYNIYTNDLVTIEGNTTPGRYINNQLSGVYNMHRTTTQKFGTNYKTYNIVGFIHLNYPKD